MKTIAQVMNSPLSSYTGSEATKTMVQEQIEARWGKTELKNFDPFHNTRTFHSWAKLGYKIKKGEKSLKSFTCIETKDKEGKVVQHYRRPVSLFYYRQVEKIGPEQNI